MTPLPKRVEALNMKKTQIGFITLIGFMFFACATQRIYSTRDRTLTMPSYEKSQAFFIGGLGQTRELDAPDICDKKSLKTVETKRTFVDGLLGVLTFGIYTPQTVKVYCE